MAGFKKHIRGSLEKRNDVALEWVYANGVLHHISDFADIPAKLRPPVYCPICSRLVILKLGSMRTHHASHFPGDRCITSTPESAVQLNTKYYLARELEKASRLTIAQQCRGTKVINQENSENSCNAHRVLVIAAGWDQVKIDYPIGPYTGEIALIKDGQIDCIIKILAGQSVEEGEKSHLRQEGIPWVAIDANRDFYAGANIWVTGIPLPVTDYRFLSRIEAWQCDKCAQKDQDQMETRPAQSIQIGKDSPGKVKVVAVRIVDFYYASGKRYREIFRVKKRVNGENSGELWINRENWKSIGGVKSGSGQPWEKLNVVFERFVETQRQKNTIIDSPMSWQAWPKGVSANTVKFGNIFPFRYAFENGVWGIMAVHADLNWDTAWSTLSRLESGISDTDEAKLESSSDPEPPAIFVDLSQALLNNSRELATCMICNENTIDWWYIDRSSGRCKCFNCLRRGKSEPA